MISWHKSKLLAVVLLVVFMAGIVFSAESFSRPSFAVENSMSSVEKVNTLENLERRGIISKDFKNKIEENQGESQTVILTFSKKPLNRKDFIESIGGKIRYDYTSIEGIAVELPTSMIKRLGELDGIQKIEENEIHHVFLEESVPLIEADQVHPPIGEYDGSGIKVCVLDTGIDDTHSAFPSGTIIGQYDFVNGDGDANDDNGHGTHVAGIIASRDDDYTGVAPGVSLLIGKVCDAGGSCYLDKELEGMDWCLDNNADVISMSFGGDVKYQYSCDTLSLPKSINRAVALGIFVSVASGNQGWIDGISSPSCASGATSVGGTYDANVGGIGWGGTPNCVDSITTADQIMCLTNRGEILDLLAPGAKICSTMWSGDPAGIGECATGFTMKTGTSMATPHVAGLAALMLEVNSFFMPLQMEQIMKDSGEIIYDNYNSQDNGDGSELSFSRINALSAIGGEIPLSAGDICYILESKAMPNSDEAKFINLLRSENYNVEFDTLGCSYDGQDIIDQTADFSDYDFWAHSNLGLGNVGIYSAVKNNYVEVEGNNELILGEDVSYLADFGYASSNVGYGWDGYTGGNPEYERIDAYVSGVNEVLPDFVYDVGQIIQIYKTTPSTVYYATEGDLEILEPFVNTYLDDYSPSYGGDDGFRIHGAYENPSSVGKMGFFGIGPDGSLTLEGKEILQYMVNWLMPEQLETIDISFSATSVEFGDADPGELKNAASNPYGIIVEETTNVNVDIYQKGDDFSDGGSESILISNLKWNKNGGGTKSDMLTSYDLVYEDVGVGSNSLYYWIQIPSGKASGIYSTNLYFNAVKTGEAAPLGSSSSSEIVFSSTSSEEKTFQVDETKQTNKKEIQPIIGEVIKLN